MFLKKPFFDKTFLCWKTLHWTNAGGRSTNDGRMGVTLYHSLKIRWGFHCPYLAQGWTPTLSTHQVTPRHLLGEPAERSNLRNADVTQRGVSGTSLLSLEMLLAALSAVPQTGRKAGGVGSSTKPTRLPLVVLSQLLITFLSAKLI